jgi:hypothetical protein
MDLETTRETRSKAKRSTAVLFFQSDDLPAEILAKGRRPPATGRSVRPGERS